MDRFQKNGGMDCFQMNEGMDCFQKNGGIYRRRREFHITRENGAFIGFLRQLQFDLTLF